MKVTLITAIKNEAKTIAATIESVVRQTHTDIDYIIVDGNSSDSTLNIALSYSARYDFIRVVSEPDTGIYNALNKAIGMAKGDIIGIIHGNDRLSSSETIAKVVERFSDSNADVLIGDIHFENSRGKITRRYSSASFTPTDLLRGIAPPHPSLYVRREVFDKYGNYKEDYLIGADFELFVRLFLVNRLPFVYLPVDMVTMSLGGLSTRVYHRVFTNNREKKRALVENGYPTSYFTLFRRYF